MRLDDLTLDYMDQASFAGLRALGRGPCIQFLWIVPGPADVEAVKRLHARLAHTLIGRRIRRSPLPFGRHRWEYSEALGGLDIDATPMTGVDIVSWANANGARPVDPEIGPTWNLAVRALTDGNHAIALSVSHSTADGTGILDALRTALVDHVPVQRPAPGRETRAGLWRRDVGVIVRSTPDVVRALSAAVRTLRSTEARPRVKGKRTFAAPQVDPRQVVEQPVVIAVLDEGQVRARAAALGGSVTDLGVGVSARLSELLGRVDDQGNVRVILPISRRTDGDTRANALESTIVTIPTPVNSEDLSDIRRTLRQGIADVGPLIKDMGAALAFTPYTPKRLVRRLEVMALGPPNTAGLSNLGVLPDHVSSVGGMSASLVAFWVVESFTPAILEHFGGLLGVTTCSAGGTTTLTVRAWQPGIVTTRAHLAPLVTRALEDFGLHARVI